MALHTERFDVADYLTDKETISAYLTESVEGGDLRFISRALADVAGARGDVPERRYSRPATRS